MTPLLLFLMVVAGIAGWLLSQQRLMAKPWLEEGLAGELPGTGAVSAPAAKIGLGVFFAVAGCLFALLISAYFIRMDMGDWRPLPIPKLLWTNTGVLAISSAALHWTSVSARKGQIGDVRAGLAVAGIAAAGFLAWQLAVWRQLSDAGYFLASNPANSFFYLLTGTHGAHLLGGLVALGRTSAKAWRDPPAGDLPMSVQLCGWYWHFLLVVWLIVFAVLMRWADGLVVICRSLLS